MHVDPNEVTGTYTKHRLFAKRDTVNMIFANYNMGPLIENNGSSKRFESYGMDYSISQDEF